MVGHTHEDVDALFGHVSTWLKRHDAVTVPGMPVYMCISTIHIALMASITGGMPYSAFKTWEFWI